MATPHVAGVAALFLQGNATATPGAVASTLTAYATANKVTNAGSGSPNRLLYSLLGTVVTPPPPPPPPTGCALAFTFNGSLAGTNASAIHPNVVHLERRRPTRLPARAGHGRLRPVPREAQHMGDQLVDRRPRGGRHVQRGHFLHRHVGTYRWRVKSFSGSGAYQFAYSKP